MNINNIDKHINSKLTRILISASQQNTELRL
jgi:hypothetical protein